MSGTSWTLGPPTATVVGESCSFCFASFPAGTEMRTARDAGCNAPFLICEKCGNTVEQTQAAESRRKADPLPKKTKARPSALLDTMDDGDEFSLTRSAP